MAYIMVLNDGETYTDLEGCFVMEVPDNMEADDIEEFIQSDESFSNIKGLFGVSHGLPFVAGPIQKLDARVIR